MPRPLDYTHTAYPGLMMQSETTGWPSNPADRQAVEDGHAAVRELQDRLRQLGEGRSELTRRLLEEAAGQIGDTALDLLTQPLPLI